MKHEPDTIDDTTAELMLYVAGELSPEAKSAFETRLGRDAALQAQASTMLDLDGVLKRDALERAPSAGQSQKSLQQAIRAVRHQTLVVQAREAALHSQRKMVNLPRWAWASAIAAAVAVVAIVMVTNSEPKVSQSIASNNSNTPMTPGDWQDRRAEIFELAGGFLPVEGGVDASVSQEIDSQVDALNILATMSSEASN